jgi:hypothetical protein
MRTETKTVNVYEYGELSPKAKEVAKSKYLSFLEDTGYWYETVFEDARTIGKLIGIKINNIYFYDVHSQSGSVAYAGAYVAKNAVLEAVKDHAPLDETLHSIASEFDRIRSDTLSLLNVNVKDDIQQSAIFYTVINIASQFSSLNKNMVFSPWVYKEFGYDDLPYENRQAIQDLVSEQLSKTLTDFSKWIFKNLQAEWEYETSEQAFVEACEANSWEFTENGELYR